MRSPYPRHRPQVPWWQRQKLAGRHLKALNIFDGLMGLPFLLLVLGLAQWAGPLVLGLVLLFTLLTLAMSPERFCLLCIVVYFYYGFGTSFFDELSGLSSVFYFLAALSLTSAFLRWLWTKAERPMNPNSLDE